MVSEVQERWPALFSCEQISQEFCRITSKDLLESFRGSLDIYVPRLLRLYRARKGAFGQKMEDVLDALDEKTSDVLTHRKTAALRGLPIFVRDDTSKFFLQCSVAGVDKGVARETATWSACDSSKDVAVRRRGPPPGEPPVHRGEDWRRRLATQKNK
ncbi:uncharacterized protein KZ484_022108 isoform 2-T7 [Pholidichthys leucotaenia]